MPDPTSLETLITQAVPKKIRLDRALDLPAPASEQEALAGRQIGQLARELQAVCEATGQALARHDPEVGQPEADVRGQPA